MRNDAERAEVVAAVLNLQAGPAFERIRAACFLGERGAAGGGGDAISGRELRLFWVDGFARGRVQKFHESLGLAGGLDDGVDAKLVPPGVRLDLAFASGRDDFGGRVPRPQRAGGLAALPRRLGGDGARVDHDEVDVILGRGVDDLVAGVLERLEDQGGLRLVQAASEGGHGRQSLVLISRRSHSPHGS